MAMKPTPSPHPGTDTTLKSKFGLQNFDSSSKSTQRTFRTAIAALRITITFMTGYLRIAKFGLHR